MGNYNPSNQSRGRSGSGRSFGGRNSRRAEMHDAVCDECGKNCQVPFRPSGGKPIYCSNCFESKGSRDSNRSNRGNFRQSGFGDRDSRPQPSNISISGLAQLTEKIEILNSRLDSIISHLSSMQKQSKLPNSPNLPKSPKPTPKVITKVKKIAKKTATAKKKTPKN